MRFPQRALMLAGCAVLSAVVSAHEVPLEQRVDMSMERQGDRLVVRMHVPTALLGNAPIQVAAGDAVRNLDVRQDDTPLPAPALSAVTGVDRSRTDIELTYRVDANTNGLSARLNGFQAAPMQVVRTTVRYVPSNGHAQLVSVVGPATRVRFDPTALGAVQDFMARALRSVLTTGDHLLLLACLLLALRSSREAVQLLAALVAGQVVGMTTFGWFAGTTPSFALVASMIASSALVFAAAQNMVNASVRYVVALALAFGVLNGVAFGDAFALDRQFAGAHQGAAFAVFLVVVIVGQLWLGAVMWATRAWLDRRGAPAWMFTIVGSAFIAHTAIHDLLDRGQALAAEGTVPLERAVFWLALAWAIVMLGVTAVEWIRQRRVAAYSTS